MDQQDNWCEKVNQQSNSKIMKTTRNLTMRGLSPLMLFIIFLSFCSAAEKPKLTPMTAPVLFNTPAADQVLAALQIFPDDNPWNEDISKLPVMRNSKEIIAGIGTSKNLAYNLDMSFILVPAKQPLVPVTIRSYPNESEPGPFPIAAESPVENWPLDQRPLATSQAAQENGDRHVIVVSPETGKLYEFYQGRKTETGWECGCAAVFDLTSNKLRPDGWTSSDAAGLPIFPAIIRFDEVEAGMVKHAMRFTVRNTRRSYVYPATHFASHKTDPNLPRMGERFRLRADFDVSTYSPHIQAILKGLKKYGMFVADNGGDWRISVAPDSRIKGLDELRTLKGADFEVIEPTGPEEGPRAH